MKKLVYLLMTSVAFTAEASEVCNKTNINCRYFFSASGSLVDRKYDNHVSFIAPDLTFAEFSVRKYGDQYILLKENLTNERAVIAVPLEEKNKKLGFRTVFYFSIDMTASTGHAAPIWEAQKRTTKFFNIDSTIWDKIDFYNQEIVEKRVEASKPSGWPSTFVYINEADKRSSDKCFVPFAIDSDHFPISEIACRLISIPVKNGSYDLSGIIGNKMLVSMHIENNLGSLIGWYTYNSGSGERIKLKGNLSNSGALILNEFALKADIITGVFRAKITDGAFSGTWQSLDGKRSYPMMLYLQGFTLGQP